MKDIVGKRKPFFEYAKENFYIPKVSGYDEESPTQYMVYQIMDHENFPEIFKRPDTEGFRALISYMALFQYQGAEIYKISRLFGTCLNSAPINIKKDYLNFDNKIRCIELPEDLIFKTKENYEIKSVFVSGWDNRKYNNKLKFVDNDNKNERPEHTVYFFTPLFDGIKFTGEYDSFILNFYRNETIEDSLKRAISFSTSPSGDCTKVILYALKCLLYINSGDPDLREYRPKPRPHSSKKISKWIKQNLSSVPMILVGFDFKKPKIYNVDSTTVRMHLRWQPYGPDRTKVKLIWINEHVRTYENREVLK